jgi:hypothetical protein
MFMIWQLALMMMEPTASLLMDFQRNGREVRFDFAGKVADRINTNSNQNYVQSPTY